MFRSELCNSLEQVTTSLSWLHHPPVSQIHVYLELQNVTSFGNQVFGEVIGEDKVLGD